MPELPMFPLGTVLFPHMVLPLHVFEPRYRELVRDVLDGDREFGVTLITHGHEVGGGDQRATVGTIARVVQAEELDDGRWLVIGVGTRRCVVTEWRADDPYPKAEITELEERDPAPGEDPATLVAAIEPRLRRVLAMDTELGHDGVPATVELDEDPAVACWQIAVFAPLSPFDAQRVLEQDSCADRLRLLHEVLIGVEQVLGFQLRAADADGGSDDAA